jgi:D-alanine-D-alanine ligase
MSKPTILLLYNEPVLPRDHPDAESEHSVRLVVEEVNAVLTGADMCVEQLGLGADPVALWTTLRSGRIDAVFNLYEGNANRAETESYVAGLLEWSGVPYTGCPFASLSLARAKHITKNLLKGAGLPTAEFLVVEALPMPAWPGAFPVFVKPAAQDASVGVDQGSVCVDAEQMDARVRRLLSSYGPPVLVEAYLAGREFQVPLIELPGLEALPVLEIIFRNRGKGAWPIQTYAGKWDPHSADYNPSTPAPAHDLPEATRRRMSDLAKAAYRLLGCRDYARVDFRLTAAGEPFILEVNPNPEISTDSGFGNSAELSLSQFIVKLAEQAMSRSIR